MISPATFHHGNGGGLGGPNPSDPGQAGGGAVAAADRLAREGLRPLAPGAGAAGVPPRARSRPRVAKVQACKVGIGPRGEGKRPGPPPSPGAAPIGPATGRAPPPLPRARGGAARLAPAPFRARARPRTE